MFNFFSKPKEPVPLCFDTDIHCHIIPGIDDGAPDVETAANLVERMQRWGLKRIIASPHVTQNTFENDMSTITPAYNDLLQELKNRNNDIPLSHHAEYRIDELFQQRVAANELMLLPGDRILIENSFFQEPLDLDNLVFDLQVKGLQPILAHPERYSYYYKRRNRYKQLHDAGVNFQINILSLAGAYGSEEREIALYLLEKGLVDYAGTDLHKYEHADAIDKYLASKHGHADMKILSKVIKNDTL